MSETKIAAQPAAAESTTPSTNTDEQAAPDSQDGQDVQSKQEEGSSSKPHGRRRPYPVRMVVPVLSNEPQTMLVQEPVVGRYTVEQVVAPAGWRAEAQRLGVSSFTLHILLVDSKPTDPVTLPLVEVDVPITSELGPIVYNPPPGLEYRLTVPPGKFLQVRATALAFEEVKVVRETTVISVAKDIAKAAEAKDKDAKDSETKDAAEAEDDSEIDEESEVSDETVVTLVTKKPRCMGLWHFMMAKHPSRWDSQARAEPERRQQELGPQITPTGPAALSKDKPA